MDGTGTFAPLGDSPRGIILYTPDGYMSAQLSAPSRAEFTSGDWFDGTLDEYRHEASTYIAYSGRFHVDEQQQTLAHSMFVSLFPNWTGQTQPRAVHLDGDHLKLATVAPIKSAGRNVHSHLTWRRAEAN